MGVPSNLRFGTDRILWAAVTLFFAASVAGSLRPTAITFRRLWEATRGADAHTLRRQYHHWYDRQYPVWEYVAEQIPEEFPILVATLPVRPDSSKAPTYFLAYYLAPRPVYYDSEWRRQQLEREGKTYAVVRLRWDADSREHHWDVRIHQGIPRVP